MIPTLLAAVLLWAPTSSPPGVVAVPGPDTTVAAWLEAVSGPAGSSVVVSVRFDLSGAGASLGAVQVRVVFDPSLVTVEHVEQGDFDGIFQANSRRVSEGVLVMAGASPDTTGNRGRVTLAEITFALVGSAGSAVALRLEVVELASAGDFRVLSNQVDVRDGMIRIF